MSIQGRKFVQPIDLVRIIPPFPCLSVILPQGLSEGCFSPFLLAVFDRELLSAL